MNTPSSYGFEIASTDLHVALDCEAERAEREHMKGTAQRQRDNALHVRNAVDHMTKTCPEGCRVTVQIVVAHVPQVNPFLRDDVRMARSGDLAVSE